MDRKFLEEGHYDPSDWSGILRNGQYCPVFTEEPVAPADLLIHLKARVRPTVLARRMDCTVAACGNCRGNCCENESPKVNVEEINKGEDGNIFDIFDDY